MKSILIFIFVLGMAVLFLPAIMSGNYLDAPDCGDVRGFQYTHLEGFALLAGGYNPNTDGGGSESPPLPLSPTFSMIFMFPPRIAILWGYILNVVLLYLATLWLLRTFELSWEVCLIGAMAMAFSTHTLTLISAGHLTKNGMMPFAVGMFAAINMTVKRGEYFWYALLGLLAGMALSDHYDVAFMFCLLAGIYFILQPGQWVKKIKGAVLALVVAAAVFLPSMCNILNSTLSGRNAQIAQSGNASSSNARWEFATAWSLPPEEIMEFVAPAIFGRETGSKDAPYWGRTGQTEGWNKTHQGLRNLRQHGLYLGMTQLVFAVLALVYAIRDGSNKRMVFFWSGAWLLCVLLALGKYGPVYWLFYSLPYMSYIRCPIKFMHLVELCTVVLFAFGLETMMRKKQC